MAHLATMRRAIAMAALWIGFVPWGDPWGRSLGAILGGDPWGRSLGAMPRNHAHKRSSALANSPKHVSGRTRHLKKFGEEPNLLPHRRQGPGGGRRPLRSPGGTPST